MDIIERTLTDSWKTYSLAKGFKYRIIDGIAIFKSGMNSAAFNYAYADKDLNDDLIEKIFRYYDNLPFTWFVKNDISQDILKKAGLTFEESWNGMSIDLDSIPPSLHNIKTEITTETVTWSEIESQGFELTGDFFRLFADALIPIQEQRFSLAYLDGRAVSAAMLSLCGARAYLAYITTLKEFRCCGAGSALVLRCLQDAKEQGCNKAMLHATTMGEVIYRKIGFVAGNKTSIWKKRI
jgi:GNAT superfamily N-acetyltransferase